MRKLIIGLVLFGLVFATNSKGIFDGIYDSIVKLPAITLNYNPPPSPLGINWVAMTNSPPPGRYWCPGTGVVRDTIWFLGGAYSMSGSNSSLRTISAYIPVSNTWLTTGLPNLLTTRRAGGGGRIGNKIYVVGGRDSLPYPNTNTLASCEEFDVDTKIMTTKASMPQARYAVASGVANGKLYIIGDENRSKATYEYDPTSNSWTTKESIPVGRGWAAAVGAGGKVYVFGGGGSEGMLNDCWEFDPTVNTWTQRANLPGTRIYHIACPLYDSVIYVIGGAVTDQIVADNIVYRYHIPSNTWTTENPMPTSRGWLMANQIGNKIYATFGSNCAIPPSYLTVNEEATFIPPPDNDVGVNAILSPGTSHSVGATMIPQALIKNYGLSNQSSFPVTCSIFGTADTLRYSDISIVSLNAGDTITVSFNNWTPTINEICNVKMRTSLLGDANPDNDVKIQVTNITNNIIIGTATTNEGYQPMYRGYNYSTHEAIYLQSEINATGNITNIAYYKHSGLDTNPIQNVTIYMKHTSATTLSTGNYDLSGYAQVFSGAFPNNTVDGWMEVTLNTPFSYNNTDNLQMLIVKGYQDWLPTYPDWRYTTTSPNYRSRYGLRDDSQPISLMRTYNRPNLRLSITPPLLNDVGVDAILTPGTQHTFNNSMTPSARVRNYGTTAEMNFKVYCVITGPGNVVRFNDSLVVTSLDSNATVNINFSAWTPTIAEFVTVKIWTVLVGDQNSANDLKTQTTNIMVVYDAAVTTITEPSETQQKRVPFIPQVTVVNNGSYSADIPVMTEIRKRVMLLQEGFNDTIGSWPPPQWDTVILSGTFSWERKLSNIDPICVPYEGEAMASFPSYYASAGSQARLVSPPINIGVTPVDLLLKFWMYHDPGYSLNPDSVKIEYSTDGINFNEVSAFRRYEPEAEWTEHTVNLSTLSGTVYIGFLAFSGYGHNMNIDKVTLLDNTVIYQDSQTVVIASGKTSEEVYFRPCTLTIEHPYHFEAYTNLSGDMYPANDKMTRDFTIIPLTLTLTSPANDTIYNDNKPLFDWDAVTGAETYRIQVDNDADFSSPVIDEVTGNDEWLVLEGNELADGTYYWHVRVESPGTPDDYSETWTLTVYTPGEPGWTPVENIPAALDLKPGKFMKDGGSMIGVGGTKDGDNIFMFPGNKSWYFYMYTPGELGTFTTLESIPYGLKPTDPTKYNKKKIGKGAALCFDNDHTIYATKGNGTTELWAYDILANTWTQDSFVPVPKALKGGTSLAYLGGKIYLLAGGQKKTDLVNFYGYDIATATWAPLGLLTLGPNVKIWKDGACLTKLDGTLYALKSNDKYNPFFSYNALTNTWTEFDSIPMLDSLAGKKKKVAVKDGGAMCASGDAIYAIKGGGTIYFWKYTTLGGWTRSDSIPRLHKKSVAKTGAAMAYANNRVFLMKGNNTPELWQYVPTAGPAAKPTSNTVTAVMVEKTNLTNVFSFNVAPNPFNRTTIIRYTVPVAGKVSVKLYNTSGRVVERVNNSYLNAGNYTTTLNASTLANGVYFLRYEDQSNRAEIKLIVQ